MWILYTCLTIHKGSIGSIIISSQEDQKKLIVQADSKIYLMVDNYIPNREHVLLVKSFIELHEANPKTPLLLAEEGSCAVEINQVESNKSASAFIKLLSPMSFSKLSNVHATSDFYVHSGCEPYSTASVYAAHIGKPQLLSCGVGSSLDILEEGINGFLFEPASELSIFDSVCKSSRLTSDETTSFSNASIEISRKLNPDAAASAICACIQSMLKAESF